MISLTQRQKERIRKLIESARGHSKKAEAIEEEVKARMDAVNAPLSCELCDKYFTTGYLAAKPDGQFGWMCSKCFDEVYKEEVTDD